ncbi:fibrobacter succinogenes major paralogous domain-containing protein [Flavobacterium sp. MMLR14_040]|uniref:fibrobacter succinogenes major paralogous domain-containing protein n=1 Tax=Flavobacterium sp. MMLR14_040 TaxID=3093843 RepID=UPI0029904586|nr:fibrobacter succinogenes major paralogous domain-containing protein [Flavobacterium sp. MMLR14_040]MDW8848921.1 fibrobacter succinogenes major paralogous domain-containing protein [Flavobacterium sp. MMLR14_040]
MDGNEYKTIKIGSQIWMAENLRVASFANGSPITLVQNSLQWQNFHSPSQAVFENKKENQKYGRIYNWFAVNASENICPLGWKIPSVEDWKTLAKNFGGLNSGGRILQDQKGFNAQLFGFRAGNFEDFGKSVFYWTSDTDPNQPELPPPGKTSKAVQLKINDPNITISNEYQIEGFYIRCLKIID